MSLLFGRRRKIPIPTTTSTSTDAIGSDRLRKAIERNRVKQVKRESIAPTSGYSSGFQRPDDLARENPYGREPDRFQGQRPTSPSYQRPINPGMTSRPTPPPMGNRPPLSRPLPVASTAPSRPLPNSNSSYSTPKRPAKFAKYFLRGLWIFSVFLLLRLVFTERGAMEYYSRKGTLDDKYGKLASLKKSNKELEKKIKKIKIDSTYQKLLVRNHLGFIARDEFIVLLPD
ncbi:MAG: hypothetical protein DRQ88_05055 [Epsilonproteobacteria bacterium]|nr:MAG: hypothetical protein DRQ89_11500 [Campylobacterota bacterium]RLA66902.1 MAG: hypothetical protein DRQ88_05055 [Campylobacterota bacterium]